MVWFVEGGHPHDSPYAPSYLPVGHRECGVTVAYVAHGPIRGAPAITCWFCAEEIEVFATDPAMPVTDPKSRLWRHPATLDPHCDLPALRRGGGPATYRASVSEPLAAVAYLRVSQGQAQDMNGLTLQESACRAHAAAAGLDLVDVITERGVRRQGRAPSARAGANHDQER